jgi:xanthine/uracil permease
VEGVPLPVLGGAGIALFGMVAASGVRTLSRVRFNNTNILVVAVAVGVGLLPTVAPTVYDEFPTWFQIIFDSGISAGALVAIVLNLLLNSESLRQQIGDGDEIAAYDAVRSPALGASTEDGTGAGSHVVDATPDRQRSDAGH